MTNTPDPRPSTDALLGSLQIPGGLSVPEYLEQVRRTNAEARRIDQAVAVEDLLEALEDVINQACLGDDGVLDSMALTAYAHGLRLLAEYGRVRITSDVGRRVIAEWPKEDT